MVRGRAGERGAALIIVLVFMVITLILITAVLAVTANEIQIAALQRDGVRALELATAGIQEAIARIVSTPQRPTDNLGPMADMDFCPASTGGGKPLGFTSSLASTDPSIIYQRFGVCGVLTGSQYLEVRADVKVGQAVRKLSRIVRIFARNVPPEIVLAGIFGTQGSAETSGDTYTPESVVYKTSPDGYTYSGWRVGKSNNPDKALADPDDTAVWCYGRTANPTGTPGDGTKENEHCTQDTSGSPDADTRWYPGTRLAVSETNDDPAIQQLVKNIKDLEAGTDPLTCAVPLAFQVTENGKRADATSYDPPAENIQLYGFDKDTDLVGLTLTNQAVTNKHRCGLPYKYVSRTFQIQDGKDTLTIMRYFKTVIFEQWFDTYFDFCSKRLSFDGRCTGNPQAVVERNGAASCSDVCLVDGLGNSLNIEPDLATNPQFAAIPPFPSEDFLKNICNNSNPYVSAVGSATICEREDPLTLKSPVNKGDYELGDPSGVDEDTCPKTGGQPRIAYFEPASGATVKFASGMQGYGTLYIEGNAEFAGGFEYTGTIIVNGDVEFGGGTVTINGGLIVKGKVKGIGNLQLNASDCIGTTAFTDAPLVELGALWER